MIPQGEGHVDASSATKNHAHAIHAALEALKTRKLKGLAVIGSAGGIGSVPAKSWITGI
jgi:hypothetical protein